MEPAQLELLIRIASATERIAEAVELQAQIALGDRGITEAEVREKMEAVRAAASAAPPPYAADSKATGGDKLPRPAGSLPVPMTLTEQSPLDLLTADLAYQHAERSFGRGRVPPDLDLASYAEEHGIAPEAGPEILEPEGPVPADIEERIAEMKSARGEL